MDWPNYEGWMALADDVEIEQEGRTDVLHLIDCGDLVAPSGRLVICDPLIHLDSWALLDEPILHITPGHYRVLVTQADVSGLRDGSHLRNAYATLLLSDSPEVRRTPFTARPDGTLAPAGPDDKPFAFGVDTDTGCFVDLLAVSSDLPIGAWQLTTPRDETPDPMVEPAWYLAIANNPLPLDDQPIDDFEKEWYTHLSKDPWLRRAVADEDWWNEHFLDNDLADGWPARIADPNHLGENVANVILPLATDGANFVLFNTGWGDGLYKLVAGYGANDTLVRVLIDFQIVNPPQPFWLGRPPALSEETDIGRDSRD